MTRSLLRMLRGALHGSDERRAVEGERRTLSAHADRAGRLEARLREAYGGAAGRGAVKIGRSVEQGWDVALPADQLRAHALLVGPSGCGKSRLAVLILKALLESGIRAVVLDPKAETVELAVAATAIALRKLPSSAKKALLSRLVLLDLFGSGDVLPRLNVLSPVPGLDEETHAYLVAMLLTSELDQGVGVRQEAILYLVIKCLLRARLPITVLPLALGTPLILDRLSETCGPAELFRTTAARLRRESKERILGLESRAECTTSRPTTACRWSAPRPPHSRCRLRLSRSPVHVQTKWQVRRRRRRHRPRARATPTTPRAPRTDPHARPEFDEKAGFGALERT